MNTTESRSEIIALRVEPEMAQGIRRAARLDDRTVSGYLRHLIAGAIRSAIRDGQQAGDGASRG